MFAWVRVCYTTACMVRNLGDALFLPGGVYARLLDDCVARAPSRAVGMLLGRNGIVRACEPLPNHARDDGVAYQPQDALAVIGRYRRQRAYDIGLYWSQAHDGPWLSADDVARCCLIPDYYFLVVSTFGGLLSANAFVCEGAEPRQVPIVLH